MLSMIMSCVHWCFPFKTGSRCQVIRCKIFECCMKCKCVTMLKLQRCTALKKQTKKKQPHPVHICEGKRGVFSCMSWNKWNNNTLTALQVASWWVKALISFPFSPLVGSLGNDRTNKCCLCFRGLKPKLSQLGGHRAPSRALMQSTMKT